MVKAASWLGNLTQSPTLSPFTVLNKSMFTFLSLICLVSVYFRKLLTLCTLTWVSIFSILCSIHFLCSWHGELVRLSRASHVDCPFLYSHDLNVWFSSDTERRIYKPITLRGQRVHSDSQQFLTTQRRTKNNSCDSALWKCLFLYLKEKLRNSFQWPIYQLSW